MSSNRSDRSFRDLAAAEGRSFRDAAEAYRFLTGKTLSADEAAEALRYESLRQRMISARKRASESQGSVARAMGTSQSEISRLENSLGPGTRLGTLLGYLDACGISPEALFAPDEARAGPAEREMRLVIEGKEFAGVEAAGILESLHAINDLLRGSDIGREQRKLFILGFLHELSKVRERGGALSDRKVDVEIEMPVGVHEPVVDVRTAPGAWKSGTLSETRFREAIAGPLSLIDF